MNLATDWQAPKPPPDHVPPAPPTDPWKPWRDRFDTFTTWFKANALNAGITLLIGYILGRVFK
jgi:hypothetical protein